MKGYQVVEDAKSHFVLQAPNGAKVRIAKNGLSSDMAKKIKGFAEGGKIEYGVSKENTINSDAAEAFKKALQGEKQAEKPKVNVNDGKKVAQYADGTPEGGVPEEAAQPQKPVDININVGQPQQPAEPQREPASGGWTEAIGNAISNVAKSPIAKAIFTGDPSHLAPPVEQPVAQPVNAAVQSAVQTQQPSPRNALAGMVPGQAQPGLIEQVHAVQKMPTVGEASAINDFQKANASGIKELNQNQEELSKAYLAGYGPASETVKKIQDHEDRYSQINKDLGELGKRMQNFELKPKTMFSGGNFFQNIGTALSVLAGGVSQGLLKSGTNPVMDYIQKQIDQDVDRQKHEYGKLENQYTILRQQGHNEAEAVSLLKAQQLQTISTMLHLNEQKTKNIQTRLGLQQAQSAMTVQAQQMAKQAAIEQTLRANLQQTAAGGAPSQGGMMRVNNAEGPAPAVKPGITEQWKTIAQSVPYLVKDEKLVPKVAEEVQRLTDAHEGAENLLSLFDSAAQNRRSIGNLINESADISGLRQNMIPFLKAKEGTPREFEAHAAEKLFPNVKDTDERVEKKRQAFIHFMQTGSTSSLLDTQSIPYPKLQLGGHRLRFKK